MMKKLSHLQTTASDEADLAVMTAFAKMAKRMVKSEMTSILLSDLKMNGLYAL